MPWNCLYTLKNALNAGFEWPKFKAFSSSIRQTRVIPRFPLHFSFLQCKILSMTEKAGAASSGDAVPADHMHFSESLITS